MSFLSRERFGILHRTLFQAAEEDYLISRVSARMVLGNQFSWSAAQAIEKFSKCALIANGVSVKNKKHDLVTLVSDLVERFPHLFPTTLTSHSLLKVRESIEYDELFFDAIKRFDKNGCADRRYRNGHLSVRPYDLQKLDQIVFLLRRICFPLNSDDEEFSNWFSRISDDPSFSPFSEWNLILGTLPHFARRREALIIGNLPNFQDHEDGSQNKWFSHIDQDPVEMLRSIERISDDDIRWLVFAT